MSPHSSTDPPEPPEPPEPPNSPGPGENVQRRISQMLASLTVSRRLVTACLIPDTSGSTFQIWSGCLQIPPAVPRPPITAYGVRGIGNPYLGRFSLAPPGGSSRRCSSRLGMTTPRPAAPGGIYIPFGIWSGSMPAPRGRRNYTLTLFTSSPGPPGAPSPPGAPVKLGSLPVSQSSASASYLSDFFDVSSGQYTDLS